MKDIKAAKSESEQLPQNLLFSSTPPLESMRLLCSLMSTQKLSKRGQKLKLGLWDISRAHFYGIPKRTIYIELPDEDASYTESGEKECGLLMKSMYGMHPIFGRAILHQLAGIGKHKARPFKRKRVLS